MNSQQDTLDTLAELKLLSKNSLKRIMIRANKLKNRPIFPGNYYRGTVDTNTVLIPAFEKALNSDDEFYILKAIELTKNHLIYIEK